MNRERARRWRRVKGRESSYPKSEKEKRQGGKTDANDTSNAEEMRAEIGCPQEEDVRQHHEAQLPACYCEDDS